MRHLEHLLDDADPVAVDDMVAPVDSSRRVELVGVEPPLEDFARQNALKLDLCLHLDDLSERAFRARRGRRARWAARPYDVAEEETAVDDGRGGLEDLGARAVGMKDFEIARLEL